MLRFQMAAIDICRRNPRFDCFSRRNVRIELPVSSLSCYLFFRNTHGQSCEAYELPRLGISCRRNKAVQGSRGGRISCLLEGSSEEFRESQKTGARIDLKLPRRSLLVTFTCDACGSRSERLINRLAYERGLVYVQCSGCSRYHKLVDNLGLVVDYKLRDEIDPDASSGDA